MAVFPCLLTNIDDPNQFSSSLRVELLFLGEWLLLRIGGGADVEVDDEFGVQQHRLRVLEDFRRPRNVHEKLRRRRRTRRRWRDEKEKERKVGKRIGRSRHRP